VTKCANSGTHRRRNSLRPISYFGSIWELYVLDLKKQVFCKKENQIHTFSHGQGTHSAKTVLIVWPKIPQMPHKISAKFVCPSPKILIFEKKSSLWVSVVCSGTKNTPNTHNVLSDFSANSQRFHTFYKIFYLGLGYGFRM
jgi:hypothetical protein